MDTRNAASLYREAAFENAPPIKIVRMLYLGALRFLDQALAEDPAGAGSRFQYHVMRADSVVTELRLSLHKDPAPEIAANLEQLYLFVEDSLRDALRDKSHEPVRAARAILSNLLDAWSAIEVAP